MKKNAVLIASIMFVAGCASSNSQRASYSSSEYPSHYEHAGAYGSTVTGTSHSYGSDIKADSSIRGGSLDARGYDQDANLNEIEGTPHPINPGKQADSSIRGGSITARERELNDNSDGLSGERPENPHLKADSSIRGGSIEARGARDAQASEIDSGVDVDVKAGSDLRSSSETQTRDDFGQGSSSTWQSDKANGSVRGSANWNSSDDLLRDNVTAAATADDTSKYEFNTDASVGGVARARSGDGSSSVDREEIQSDLNAADAQSSAVQSERSTDITHGESALSSSASIGNDSGLTASGSAATAESGRASSSAEIQTTDEFNSNDPGMHKSGSPLGTAAGEPNFLYRDNRAHGVGSATSGDFATAPVNQNIELNSQDLSQRVKGTLTRESSGTQGLLRQEVARNVQVTAEDGVVTLTGTVPSQKDKDMLEIRAREISGVKNVKNELTVSAAAEPSFRDATRGSDLEDVTDQLQH